MIVLDGANELSACAQEERDVSIAALEATVATKATEIAGLEAVRLFASMYMYCLCSCDACALCDTSGW